MSYERFKQMRAQNAHISPDDIPPNPYAKNVPKPNSVPKENSLKTDGHLIGQVAELKREIKDLRQDIASLISIINGEDDVVLTAEEARAIYYDFRSSSSHILNRISDKFTNQGVSKI